MSHEALFRSAPVGRLFLRIAIPGAIGMLFSAIYPVLDGFFISMFLGGTAYNAANIAFPFIIISYSLSDLIGVGSSVIIAIRLGEGRKEEARSLFTSAILLILLVQSIVATIAFFAGGPILHAMGAKGELLEQATSYMRAYTLLLPVTSLAFAMDNYLRICGHFRYSMFLNILMSLLIVGLDPLFLGAFRMPIWGSALAANISFSLVTLLSLLMFLRKDSLLRFVKPSFSPGSLFLTFKNGLPVFLSNIAGRLTAILFNALLLSWAGEDGVAALGTLMLIEGFVLPILYGTCDSLQPAIGYNWGAGNKERVRGIQGLVLLGTGTVSLLAFLLMASIPGTLASLFLESDSALRITTSAIFIYGFTWLTRFLSYAVQNFYSAIGKPLLSTAISLTVSLLFPLLLVLVLWGMGTESIWLNFPLSSLLAGILALLILFFRKRMGEKEKAGSGEPASRG